MEIQDKKGVKNVVADHLSCLEAKKGIEDPKEIEAFFSNKQLMVMETRLPWYADFVNYLTCNLLPPGLSSQQRKKFLHDVRCYQWDDPLMFKRCVDKMIRRCVPQEEYEEILSECRFSPYGGHFGGNRSAQKVLQSRFFWPTLFKVFH